MSSLIGYVILQEVLHGKHIIPLAKEDLIESLISLIVGRRT